MTIAQNYPAIKPSLLLDFANVKALDPRVTFARASTATYYDGHTVAKAEQNLLSYSQEFGNGIWEVQDGATKGAAVTAPDGTATAREIVLTTTSGTARVQQGVPVVSGLAYTFSVWARVASGTLDIKIGNLLGGAWDNISLTTTWQRFSVIQTATVTGNRYPSIAVLSTAGTIEVWGAQLEQRSAGGAYTPTTDQPITNYIPLLQTASANVPRFDHDPATGESLGLLVEEQRTNLVLNSDTLSTQNVTVTAVAHTLSFYGTGQIVLSGTATATVVGLGAFPSRVTLTFTPTAGTLTLTVTGTVEKAQLEAGAFPTSYIPTVASQVTRSADSASMTGTNFSDWYNQAASTFYSEHQSVPATNQRIYAASDGTGNNAIQGVLTNSGGSGLSFEVRYSGAVVASVLGSIVPVNGQYYKIAGSYAVNDISAARDSVLGTTDTSANTPVVDRFYIGAGYTGVNYINGTIKKLAYYPQRLTNAQLQALTS